MILLAIEGSREAAGLCLHDGARVIGTAGLAPGSGRAGFVLLLRDLLAGHGIRPAGITDVAVHTGPGSGTGLRMAVAMAQAFWLADQSVRLHGVPLEALALRSLQTSPVAEDRALLLADAQGGEVFVQRFSRADAWRAEGGLEAVPLAEAAAIPGPLALLDATDGRPPAGLSVPASWRRLPGPLPSAALAADCAAGGAWLTRPEDLDVRYLKKSSAEILWEKRHGQKG